MVSERSGAISFYPPVKAGGFLLSFLMEAIDCCMVLSLWEVIDVFNQWMPQAMPQTTMQQTMQQLGYQQRQEVLKVNGENGARMLTLPPNSSVLALDEREPLVWFAQTDGAGYKTVTAYKIEPVQDVAAAGLQDLTNRVARLEALYGKPDTGADGNGKDE